MKRQIILILKILIAISIFTWLIESGKLDFSVLSKDGLDNIFHLAGLATLLASMLIQVMRWLWILKANNIYLPFVKACRISWAAGFLSLVLPGAAGGDIVRSYYIATLSGKNKIRGIGTVFMDRFIGTYSLLAIGAFSSFLSLMLSGLESDSPVIKMAAINLMLFTAASIFIAALFYLPFHGLLYKCRLQGFGNSLHELLAVYRNNKRMLGKSFFLSIAGNMLDTLSYLFAGYAVNTPISITSTFIAGPLVTLANIAPISPGGAGVAEATAYILFSQFGTQSGAVIMFLTRIWVIILKIPGLLFYIAGTKRRS